MPRSFLFLQGTASPFFSRLASTLVDRGHRALRVNFCGGDRLFAGAGDVIDYGGTVDDLSGWYAKQLKDHGCTDVVLFGDCRPVHRAMHPLAEQHELAVHVFEEGYVRPDWLTLERHGVNGRSKIPRDPAWFVAKHKKDPVGTQARDTGYSLRQRAWSDICYRMANTAWSKRYPHYQNHRPRNGMIEYAGLASRFSKQAKHQSEAENELAQLLGKGDQYFLFPLQLGSDAQIVEHSPFNDVREAIECVVSSFARNARRGAVLVIKNHPLDTGLIDYRRYTLELALKLGIEDRLRYIEAGHLPTLLNHAQGVVVVNSTVGLSALHHQCPVVTLGHAIYDIDRLTWQHGIDSFWTCGMRPDMNVYWAFLDFVIKNTQINGNFYTKMGIDMAIPAAVARLEAEHA